MTRSDLYPYARLRENGADVDQEDGTGTLLGVALATVLSALLWVLIILAIRWVLQLPPPALLRVSAVAGLFVGTVLIFVALVQLELTIAPSPDLTRGRRPGAEAARRGESAPPVRPPSRGADAPTNTPRVAGPRALRAGQPS